MLTSLRVRNFKRFEDVEIDLGSSVVFIGPNNSGKTTALQALALWHIGIRRWNEKRAGKTAPEERPGVTINRRDLIAIPVPDAKLLWRDLDVRNVQRLGGKQDTKNIRIDIIVSGVTEDKEWSCGLEFDYANEESFYCRPLRKGEGKNPQRWSILKEASLVQMAFLPPMSGLTSAEPKWPEGRINVLIGEGRTAEVLRNLCYQICSAQDGENWKKLTLRVYDLFGVDLDPPQFITERGEITMSYRERREHREHEIRLDLSSSGRGLQQTLLLLAYLYANPKTVLLLDEPDAHLEILRQRQIYQVLNQVADEQGSQLIMASHSEVVLEEAANRDMVIAFVGLPHRIDDRGSQALKALKEIGFQHYYSAEQTGWVLYLEGPTDLAILKAFADTLGHEAAKHLERPFVHYVGNQPPKARDHFFGLQEAKPDLVGIAVFDHDADTRQQQHPALEEYKWQRREIENYLCLEHVLVAYARADQPNDLFGHAEAARREQAMKESIQEVSDALKTLGEPDPWSPDIKATDHFLDRLFKAYFRKLGLPNLLQKTDYHILARLVPKELIADEVKEKLDAIVTVARKAKPRGA